MKNYFYKINQKYIQTFSRNVLSRFASENIRSNVTFLKSVFTELNKLFQRMGGRVSSKRDIPRSHEYPDSTKFNRLITNIAFDIDKIYTAQKLIEDDVNNLLNFNSTQRIRTFENLTTTQQEVYSTYIKNKGDMRGEIIIPADNPFGSADNISSESEGIYIDEGRGILTLASENKDIRPVSLNGVRMFFAGSKPIDKTYPSKDIMGLGSHWKIPSKESHHINSDNPTDELNYKSMLIDDPNNNFGVGFCEFEGVITIISSIPSITPPTLSYRLSGEPKSSVNFNIKASLSSYQTPEETKLKNFIGDETKKDPELIYLDIPNSLQGQYVRWKEHLVFNFGDNKPQYKLVIPFTQDAPYTNQFIISVQPNSLYLYPKLIWRDSKVFSNIGGTDVAYNLIAPTDDDKITDNGEYICAINGGYIKPSRAEIIFEYGGNDIQWDPIEFIMGHWVYSAYKNYRLPYGSTDNITLVLGKTYDIFVDAEPDGEKEKQRALNVLLARGK
jgi:hypothetical protein